VTELLLLYLDHRADALGTKRLLDLSSVFDYRDLLQVRFESTVGCPQRKAAVMTKGRRFSTIIALRHFDFLSLQTTQFRLKSRV
jgi:hypothetical protein